MNPSPPVWWSHLLFEKPMALVVTWVLVGVILLWHGNRRLNRRIMLAGGGLFLLAGLMVMMAWLVVTPREQLIARTESLIVSTSPLQLGVFRSHFAEDATLSGPGGAVWLSLDQVYPRLEGAMRRYNIGDNAPTGIEAQAISTFLGVSEFEVRSLLGSEYGDRPVRTRWLAQWRWNDQAKQWQIADMQWASMENATPSLGMLR